MTRSNTHRILATLLIIFAIFSLGAITTSPALAADDDQTASATLRDARPKATRTIMLYLCGTDLEARAELACHNLYQILGSNFSADDNINFIILTGGCTNWHMSNKFFYDPGHPLSCKKRHQHKVQPGLGSERI